MRRVTLNTVSVNTALVLSLVALLTVFAGYFTPHDSDEGALAHIFQLSIVALAPTFLLFAMTADWNRPVRAVGRLAASGAILAVALVALFCLEHR